MDSKYEISSPYTPETYALRILIHATHADFIRRAVGRKLTENTIEIAKKLNHDTDALRKPELIIANWTTIYAKRIGESFAFQEILNVPYTEFQFNGKLFADRIDKKHQSAVLAVKKL